MAPRLSLSKHNQIDAMLERHMLDPDIVDLVGCSTRTVRRLRVKRNKPPMHTATPATLSNPLLRIGRGSRITPYMEDMLRQQLVRQADMFRSEMRDWLHEKTDVYVSLSAISRTLKAIGWTRKTCRRVAQQRDQELRNLYLRRVSFFKSEQLIFVDESGCDKKAGQRRMGWSPLGSTPVKVDELNRDVRYQILPAYNVKGILLSRIYTGSTDAAWFEDFVHQLLRHCRPWPGPRSVLVMDNASWHNKESIERICAVRGVKVLFLPPYSPDFNPIEEFFAELKAYIKRCWNDYQGLIKADFRTFLRLCVQAVGSREASARGHFRHAGLIVED